MRTLSLKSVNNILSMALAGVTVIAVLAVLHVAKSYQNTVESVRSNAVLLKASGDSDMMHDAFRADFFRALLRADAGDLAARAEIEEEFKSHRKIWLEALDALKNANKPDEVAAVLQETLAGVKPYMEQTETLITLAYTNLPAAKKQEQDFHEAFEKMEAPLAKLSELIVKHSSETQAKAAAQATLLGRVALIGGLIIGLLVAAMLVWSQRAVREQVLLLVGLTRQMASGDADLTRRLPDFTGELGESMNTFIDRFEQIIGEVSQRANAVATAAAEIGAGSAELSARTEEQASTLEEAASSMEEFLSSVKETAAHTDSVMESARRAIEGARHGQSVVAGTSEAIQSILMQSKRMTEIIGIIDSIAFQTNILALNAAVEAARAGDQGRGFSVVAAEVRALAQRSAASAKDIRQLIKETVASVDVGASRSMEANEALAAIVTSSAAVEKHVQQIRSASQEQVLGIDQVSKAIFQLEGVTQQNASMVEEAAAATESLSHSAQLLKNLVSGFKIGSMPVAQESAPARKSPVRHAPAGLVPQSLLRAH